MEKGKHLIIKLLIVLVSVLSIDGGRSLMSSGSKMQILLNHDHNEIEVPHQHQLLSHYEDEKWVDTSIFDFFCLELCALELLIKSESTSQEFTDPVWQPPRIV
jgi:hypothetical protein